MKYQVGEAGRIILARFEDGEDILKNIASIAKEEDIKASIFYLLGGITDARIVVGPADDVSQPPDPVWRDIAESHEVLGIGTIFWYKDEPKIHFHGTYGKHDSAKTGCLREKGKTFIVMEAVLIEIKGVSAVRDLDSITDMVLLKLQ
jgi:predicted DNA-binding protein with PD1-like motif